LSELTSADALLLLVAACGIGFSKSGFAGVSLLHVLIFAHVFGAKASTGVLLPMLVIGDALAISFFGKKADWAQVRKLMPPAMVGVILGTALMGWLEESAFKPLVGCIILLLAAIQLTRTWNSNAFEQLPHARWFAISLGLLAGVTTMVANAAGPIVALYLLAVALPKLELVGTSAWLFLLINVFKLPFSYGLGLIDLDSLGLNIVFSPAIAVGMLAGRWSLNRLPQRWFDSLLLAFTALAAIRMLLGG
jgi:uncharacterized protein